MKQLFLLPLTIVLGLFLGTDAHAECADDDLVCWIDLVSKSSDDYVLMSKAQAALKTPKARDLSEDEIKLLVLSLQSHVFSVEQTAEAAFEGFGAHARGAIPAIEKAYWEAPRYGGPRYLKVLRFLAAGEPSRVRTFLCDALSSPDWTTKLTAASGLNTLKEIAPSCARVVDEIIAKQKRGDQDREIAANLAKLLAKTHGKH